jgi:hypothetical protein
MPGEGDINNKENTKILMKGTSIYMCILQNSTAARTTRTRNGGTSANDYSP